MKNIFCSYFLWHLVHWIRDDLGVTASVCYFHTTFSNQSLHLDIHGWRISHVERNLCKVSNVTLIFPAEIRTPLSQQDEWRGNWDLREISYTHIAGSDSGTVALCHHNMVALASLPRLSSFVGRQRGIYELVSAATKYEHTAAWEFHWHLAGKLGHLETTCPMKSSAPNLHVSNSLRNSSVKVLINLYKFSDRSCHSPLITLVVFCDDSVFIIDMKCCRWGHKGEQRIFPWLCHNIDLLSPLSCFCQASTVEGNDKCNCFTVNKWF